MPDPADLARTHCLQRHAVLLDALADEARRALQHGQQHGADPDGLAYLRAALAHWQRAAERIRDAQGFRHDR